MNYAEKRDWKAAISQSFPTRKGYKKTTAPQGGSNKQSGEEQSEKEEEEEKEGVSDDQHVNK